MHKQLKDADIVKFVLKLFQYSVKLDQFQSRNLLVTIIKLGGKLLRIPCV